MSYSVTVQSQLGETREVHGDAQTARRAMQEAVDGLVCPESGYGVVWDRETQAGRTVLIASDHPQVSAYHLLHLGAAPC